MKEEDYLFYYENGGKICIVLTWHIKYVILNIYFRVEVSIILVKDIKQDIESMPRKILDISLIEDNKSDLTFLI